ncbi:ABC transporter ATP-binding protein [Desulfobacula toluolica]|uniref:ABC transporter, ATP-binding protein, related to Nod factor export n=1 Tax=Desulfobacula toluolica (strain DSM 7467 / Tol2) TaxID=651182 RepID=K0NLB0_DESTT|nr:ABC transporter ATP-binding protein [Desulfobacula toluolica]CCK82361.1 ABC transporter, ATP-binding protein, related to Nod factor export [Desulfobacula toluolica Tol2]
MDAIEIEDLKKVYKDVTALGGVNLRIKQGELFAYLGPNGAGKTTTIRILTGLTRPGSGRCRINGFDIQKNVRDAKRQYGLVPQAVNLDQELTVAENLMIHGRLFQMSASAIRKETDRLLGYVDLKDRKKTPVKNLSGGMKRRLMIARALLHAPGVLFLDEPTAGLDPGIRRRIWALIKKIQSQGTTVFLTTHYIEEAEFLADRVAFLDKGQIVALNTPENFMKAIGSWAIDRLKEDVMETVYFKDRQSAEAFNTRNLALYTLRRVNLEDAFLSLTGKKVGGTS